MNIQFMKSGWIRRALAVGHLVCCAIVMIGYPAHSATVVEQQAADNGTLSLMGISVSDSKIRDGQTITLGYQIVSNSYTTVRLGATLTGPMGELAGDCLKQWANYDFKVTPGINWCFRDFLVNLPPKASTGEYDLTCTAKQGANSPLSLTAGRGLMVLPPVLVRIPILMYHEVGLSSSGMYVAPLEFQAEMAILKAYGYTIITPDDLMRYRAGLATAPPKPVMITFDDGSKTYFTDAFPILSAFNIKSTMFLPTAIMWDPITQLYPTGLVDFESHTATHPKLTTIVDLSALSYELTAPKKLIDTRLGTDIKYIAYPSGDYNFAVQQACRDAGYFAGFAASGGVETNCADKWALKRVGIFSNATVNYDPSNATSFFPRPIGDSDIKVPNISINSIQFLDPATNSPILNGELMWNQTVKVRVTAANTGPATDIIANLILDNDTNINNGVVYDSHSYPVQDIAIFSWLGQQTFEWLWTPPQDAPGAQYYALMSIHDKYFVLGYRQSGYQSVFALKNNLLQLTSAKQIPDSEWGVIRGAIVTAAFPDFFYVETDSRSSGLRVEKVAHGISAGSRVDMAGTFTTNASGEHCFIATTVAVRETGQIVAPLALSNADVGGGTLNHQMGVWHQQIARSRFGSTGAGDTTMWTQASGLNNIGLLIRTWGQVKFIDMVSRTLNIDDGSGTILKCKWTDDNLIKSSWNYVFFTGISSCEKVGDQIRPLVLITRAQGQILP